MTPSAVPRPPHPILPGATIGVFGSGQLGRMLALVVRRMGYRLHTYSPERNSPTGQVADREICGAYDDEGAVQAFVQDVDVVTFEFENVPSLVAQVAADAGVPVRPGGHVLHAAQNRLREKSTLAAAGLPVTPFAPVQSPGELAQAVAAVGLPGVLKTAAFGYDGKGQVAVASPEGVEAAWLEMGRQPAILESYVDFICEISVVAARTPDGAFAHFGAIENIHRNHILDLSIAPARIDPPIARQAVTLARAVMEALDAVGVLCVEFFVRQDGSLAINEIAPRPHNSGHLTIEGAVTSQFEQQLRAVCGLPLGDTQILQPTVMANLLGDLWQEGEPNWAAACREPRVKLHLYGKAVPRPGRKMGHLTATAPTVDMALAAVLNARTALAAP